MNGYYEHERDNLNDLTVMGNKSFIYPAHFHQKLELFILKSGEMEVVCNGKKHLLDSGSIAFFNSYDVHAYNYQSQNLDGFCLIIPQDYASKFVERNKNKTAKNPIIKNSDLTLEVYGLIEKYLINQQANPLSSSCVEFILSLIENSLALEKTNADKFNDLLIKKLLIYINENFKGDVTLKTISKNLGYTEGYVSKLFNKFIKKSLNDYVNELRFSEVEKLIKNTDTKLTQAIFDAGFKSVQTYYRSKRKYIKK